MAKAIISKMTQFIEAIEARYIARPFFVWFQHGEDRDLVTAVHKAEHPEQWTGGQPIFIGWAVGVLPREQFCSRLSLERGLPAVRRVIARRRDCQRTERQWADYVEPEWRDLAGRFGSDS